MVKTPVYVGVSQSANAAIHKRYVNEFAHSSPGFHSVTVWYVCLCVRIIKVVIVLVSPLQYCWIYYAIGVVDNNDVTKTSDKSFTPKEENAWETRRHTEVHLYTK